MWNLWRPAGQLYFLDNIEPVLESWNRKDHPDQVRLQAYLAALMQEVGPLPAGGPLSLS
jgi:hypothetical protein